MVMEKKPVRIIMVIMNIAMLLLLGIIGYRDCRKNDDPDKAWTKSMISRLEFALTEYHSDYSVYPPDDLAYSSKPLVAALSSSSNKQLGIDFAILSFNLLKPIPPKESLSYPNPPGYEIISPMNNEFVFYYEENASETVKTARMKNPKSYDIWVGDYDGNGNGPTAEDKEKATICNWQIK